MFCDTLHTDRETSSAATASDSLSSPTLRCLITMHRLTLPITATQSDFHDPVGAACSQLSRNYSPCMYRKPSSAAQPLAAAIMDWQSLTRMNSLTDLQGKWHMYAVCVCDTSACMHGNVCRCVRVQLILLFDLLCSAVETFHLCITRVQMALLFHWCFADFTLQCLHEHLPNK